MLALTSARILLPVCFIALIHAASAESIRGIVRDLDGLPVSRATVVLLADGKLRGKIAITPPDGRFTFNAVSRYSQYRLYAERDRARSEERELGASDLSTDRRIELRVPIRRNKEGRIDQPDR